jgi:hypothetical protein
VGKLYWAAATVSYIHRSTGFDLETLVGSVGTEGAVDSIMDRFIAAAYLPLAREVASLETEDPVRYKAIIAPDGQRPLEIVVSGWLPVPHSA